MKRILSIITAMSAFALAACTDLTPVNERIDALEERVGTVEESLSSLNSDLQLLNDVVSGMKLSGASCENGVWTLKTAGGNTYKVAVNGAKGNAPVLSINIDLIVEADKVEQNVEVGSRSAELKLFVNGNGNWAFSAEGKEYEIKDAEGKPVTAVIEVSDGYFSSVEVKDKVCTLTLKTGEEYRIGVQPEYHMYIVGAAGMQEIFEGETRSYELDLLNITDISIVTPPGFSAKVTDDVLYVTAVATKVSTPDPSNTITLTGISEDGRACIARMNVIAVKGSYYEDFIAGTFQIDGDAYSDFAAAYVTEDINFNSTSAAGYSGKILFVVENAKITVEAGARIDNVIFVGDNKARKTQVVFTGQKPDHRLGGANSVVAFKNVEMTVPESSGSLSWIGAGNKLKALVFDHCTLRFGNTFNGSASGGYEKFAVVGCDIFIPAGTDDMRLIDNAGGTYAKNVHIENNLVACSSKCGFRFVRDDSKLGESESVNISYNTFIGIKSFGLARGLVQAKSVSGNVTFCGNLFQNTDANGSGNVCGVSLADAFSGTLTSENNYRCFVEGVLDIYHGGAQGTWFAPFNHNNTNPTLLYTNVNIASEVFEKNPEVKAFGAQR